MPVSMNVTLSSNQVLRLSRILDDMRALEKNHIPVRLPFPKFVWTPSYAFFGQVISSATISILGAWVSNASSKNFITCIFYVLYKHCFDLSLHKEGIMKT